MFTYVALRLAMLTLNAQDGKPPIVVEDRTGSPIWPFIHPKNVEFVPVAMRHEFFRLCGDLGWADGRSSGPFLCQSGDVVVIRALSVSDIRIWRAWWSGLRLVPRLR